MEWDVVALRKRRPIRQPQQGETGCARMDIIRRNSTGGQHLIRPFGPHSQRRGRSLRECYREEGVPVTTRFEPSMLRRTLARLCFVALLIVVGVSEPTGAGAAQPDDVGAAVTQTFAKGLSAPIDSVAVDVVTRAGDWAFGTVAGQVDLELETPPFLFLARPAAQGWDVALGPGDEFARWVPDAPTGLLRTEVAAALGMRRAAADRSGSRDRAGTATPRIGLPWATGDSWELCSGPHYDDTNLRPFWALDFCKLDANGNRVNGGRVLAAADGIAFAPRCAAGGAEVVIVHEDGWETSYYHLQNIAVRDNQPIDAGTFLGTTSNSVVCGGSSTAPHVHLGLRRNGIPQEFAGHVVGGWLVESASTSRLGCLSKGQARRCPYKDLVYNDGALGACVQPSLKSSPFRPGSRLTYTLQGFQAFERVNLYIAVGKKNVRLTTFDRGAIGCGDNFVSGGGVPAPRGLKPGRTYTVKAVGDQGSRATTRVKVKP